ncbi:pro-neuregulin-1, membrane-bound isoform isoform X3 [Pelodiscus sinensis]|uniref:pro-neuregulin-1, membrane-bound isoform isoform X3 n=1 Tax=Pelodiscus sinensis TaxID=13735 RepID=UPI003F6C8002
MRPPPPPLLLLLLGTSALAAAPPCSPAGSLQELAGRAAVVIEGRVLAGGEAAGQPPAPAPSAPPPAWLARVRVHQVWAAKGGGLRKDALLWLRGEPGAHCGRPAAGSRYIFFMEPLDAGAALFRAASPPLESGRSAKRELGRALCRGCGRATSEGPIQHSLAPTETNGSSSSSYNTVPPKLKELKNQESAVGQTLVLRCEANSEYPPLRFKWFKNGKEITKKNKPENVKISKKQKMYSELHIYRASLADAGEYTCKVSSKLGNDSTKASITITDTNEPVFRIQASTEGTNASSSTSTSTTGTSHLTKCDIKQKAFCVNGGECYMVKDLPNPPRYLCRCQPGFTGARCTDTVPMKIQNQEKAEELYQKRVLTITGICIALLVVGIMCVVAYCKTKKQRKKLHDRLRQSLRSERHNMVNVANGPHHPNPPPENVQLVNQHVSKNVIASEHVIERETETSFSTSRYTSTTHHSTTVTQTPSHSWSNGRTESILSESHSVLMSSSVENSRHASPAGPRGRLSGIGGPREYNSFLRHARETPDSYRDSPHSERYVSAMTTPARMSPVDFRTPSSPKSPPSEMSPPVSSLTVSVPSVAVSPFMEEERPLLLVTPPRLREKYDSHLQQFNSFHHNPAHESNSPPPSPLRIVEDEEYETTQEYEPAQEPPKKLVNSRRAKRTKPNGHISNRLEADTDTSSESSSSESETEDERIGEDTPFLSIQNPVATSLEPAPAYRLADSRTNPTSRFSTQEELQARLSSVIANQDPIAV